MVGFQVAVGTLGQDRNRDMCVHVEKYIFDEERIMQKTLLSLSCIFPC